MLCDHAGIRSLSYAPLRRLHFETTLANKGEHESPCRRSLMWGHDAEMNVTMVVRVYASHYDDWQISGGRSMSQKRMHLFVIVRPPCALRHGEGSQMMQALVFDLNGRLPGTVENSRASVDALRNPAVTTRA